MRMFNADGSEGRMCGNAIRCVGKYYYETYMLKDAACCILTSKASTNNSQLSVETLSGTKHLTLQITPDNLVESITVDMGTPSLNPTDIPILTDAPFINQPISLDYPPKLGGRGQSPEEVYDNSSLLTPHSTALPSAWATLT